MRKRVHDRRKEIFYLIENVSEECITFWLENDFVLYNMAGNVNEWVYDIYRPLNFQDVEDLNPIRQSDYLDSEENYDYQNFNSLVSNSSRVY